MALGVRRHLALQTGTNPASPLGEVPSASEAERVVTPLPASSLAPSLEELSAQLTEDVPLDAPASRSLHPSSRGECGKASATEGIPFSKRILLTRNIVRSILYKYKHIE